MKVFISGPMTGIEGYNFPKFNRYETILTEKGYEVVNPVHICKKYKEKEVLASTKVFNQMVNEELQELVKCDAIFLLDGWNESEGSKLELENALMHDLKIITEEDILQRNKELEKIRAREFLYLTKLNEKNECRRSANA